jgi:alanine dehydrogenase
VAVVAVTTASAPSTAAEPVFPPDALSPGTLVVAIGAFTAEMQELDPAVLDGAGRVFADVPTEVAGTGDVLGAGLDADDLVPLGALLAEGYDRDSPDGTLVVESVGSATLDAAAGTTIYRRALEQDAGTEISL